MYTSMNDDIRRDSVVHERCIGIINLLFTIIVYTHPVHKYTIHKYTIHIHAHIIVHLHVHVNRHMYTHVQCVDACVRNTVDLYGNRNTTVIEVSRNTEVKVPLHVYMHMYIHIYIHVYYTYTCAVQITNGS